MATSNETRAIDAGIAAALLTVGLSVCLAALGHPLAAFIVGAATVVVAILIILSLFAGWPVDIRAVAVAVDPRRQLLKDKITVFADEAVTEMDRVYNERRQGAKERFRDWLTRVEALLTESLEPAEVHLFMNGVPGEAKSPQLAEAAWFDTYGARLRRLLATFDQVQIRDDWRPFLPQDAVSRDPFWPEDDPRG